ASGAAVSSSAGSPDRPARTCRSAPSLRWWVGGNGVATGGEGAEGPRQNDVPVIQRREQSDANIARTCVKNISWIRGLFALLPHGTKWVHWPNPRRTYPHCRSRQGRGRTRRQPMSAVLKVV